MDLCWLFDEGALLRALSAFHARRIKEGAALAAATAETDAIKAFLLHGPERIAFKLVIEGKL